MKKKATAKTKPWWVYIIQTHKGSLYTGITTDLQRRFRQHAGEIKGGAKFFNSTTPEEILFTKKCKNRSEASKLEAHIKGLRKADKLKLIISAS